MVIAKFFCAYRYTIKLAWLMDEKCMDCINYERDEILVIAIKPAGRPMLKMYFSLIILLGFYSICWGQKLVFYKNKYRQALYKEGDNISFLLKNDASKITGKIIGFEDSLIVFSGFKVNPKEISHLYVDRKTKIWYILRYKYEGIFLIIGVGYPLLEFANQGALNKSTLIIGSSLIAAGLLAKWLISDKIKITGKKRLYIIN